MKKEKIGLLFDSSCAFNKEEILKMGAFFVPITVEFGKTIYESGINITSEIVEKKIKEENIVPKTASVALGSFINVLTEIDNLKKFDKIIYISLSKFLSATNDIAKNLSNSDEWKDKFVVYDSQIISPWMFEYTKQIIQKSKEVNNVDELFKFLDSFKNVMNGILIPGSLKYLKLGGRISKFQYAMGSLLKINPLIHASGGRIDQGIDKVRGSVDKVISFAIDLIEKKWASEFKKNGEAFKWGIGHSFYFNDTEKIKEKIISLGYKIENIISSKLSSEIVAHVGPGYYFIGLFKDI